VVDHRLDSLSAVPDLPRVSEPFEECLPVAHDQYSSSLRTAAEARRNLPTRSSKVRIKDIRANRSRRL
jgi:hypothetical protein